MRFTPTRFEGNQTRAPLCQLVGQAPFTRDEFLPYWGPRASRTNRDSPSPYVFLLARFSRNTIHIPQARPRNESAAVGFISKNLEIPYTRPDGSLDRRSAFSRAG